MKENHTEPASSPRRLIPITKWNSFHAWPPIGGLRHLAFHSKTNGFDFCLVRVGRRILIDEAKFFQWIDAQKNKEGGR